MANGFQRYAHHILRRGGLAAWMCRREVVADGGCFFDSVLAVTEDKAVAQTVPDRFYRLQRAVREDPDIAHDLAKIGVELTEVRVLRLALAKFMNTDETLQGLEWFTLYKNITLDDPLNEGRSWEEYLFGMRYTNEYADQLQIMCMALFCGKDIMQTCPDYSSSDPWVRIPGQIDGWPHPATRPPITLFYTGLRGVQHYEPIMYIGDGNNGSRRARTIEAAEDAGYSKEKDEEAQLRGSYSAYMDKYTRWKRVFRKRNRREPAPSDLPENIRSCMQKCKEIAALLSAKEEQSALNSRQIEDSIMKSFEAQRHHAVEASEQQQDDLDFWSPPAENYDEDVGMVEDKEEDATTNEDHTESSNNNNDQEAPMEASTNEELAEAPANECATNEETPTNDENTTAKEAPTVEAHTESPAKAADGEKTANMRKSFHEFYAKILAWEEEFERVNGRKAKSFERTPEIKKCYRDCEYIQTFVAVEPPKTEQNKPAVDVVSVPDADTVAGIKDIDDGTTTDAQEDIEKHPNTKTSRLSELRMFRRRSRRPGGPGLGLRV